MSKVSEVQAWGAGARVVERGEGLAELLAVADWVREETDLGITVRVVEDGAAVTTSASALELVTCEWFALCDRGAAGLVAHPVLGAVPTCQRCADELELELVTFAEAGV